MEWSLAVVALTLLGAAAISRRLSGTPVTSPIGAEEEQLPLVSFKLAVARACERSRRGAERTSRSASASRPQSGTEAGLSRGVAGTTATGRPASLPLRGAAASLSPLAGEFASPRRKERLTTAASAQPRTAAPRPSSAPPFELLESKLLPLQGRGRTVPRGE